MTEDKDSTLIPCLEPPDDRYRIHAIWGDDDLHSTLRSIIHVCGRFLDYTKVKNYTKVSIPVEEITCHRCQRIVRFRLSAGVSPTGH